MEKRKQITIEEAIAIARRICQEQGWPFLEPVEVESENGNWFVTTNSKARGCNALITVSKSTGETVEIGFAPR